MKETSGTAILMRNTMAERYSQKEMRDLMDEIITNPLQSGASRAGKTVSLQDVTQKTKDSK